MATSKASEQPDKKPKKKQKAEKIEPKDERWWLLTDDLERMARIAWDYVWKIHEREGHDRRQDARDSDELYEGESHDVSVEAPSYNIIQACVDTLVAHTLHNQIRPFFITEEGEWDDRTKAECMQKAIEGDFEKAGLWGPVGREFCYDGNKYEAGMLKWTPDYANKRILIERMFSWEFFVPPREARKGKPRQGFHLMDIDRSVLRDRIGDKMTPELDDAITHAPVAPQNWFDLDEVEEDTVSDRIMVGEFWHLPSGLVNKKDAKQWDLKTADHDGVHIWVLGGTSGEKGGIDAVMLRAEAWPFDFFPIMEFKPRKKSRSYWSRSVPRTIIAAQIAVNRMNSRVDAVMHLHSVPRTYVWKKAGINTEKVTNAHNGIIEGNAPAGQAISWHTPASISGDYIDRVDKIIAWAEKVLGLPEFAIAPNKPPGIEHAPALQFLSEEQSVRHTPTADAWKEAFVQGARIHIEMARLLAKVHPDFTSTWGDAKDLQEFRWKDIDLDDMRFKLTCQPTNLLSKHPSAQMQQIIDLKREGLVMPAQTALYVGEQYPDVKAMMGDTASIEKVIRKRIQSVVKDGYNEKNAPDAYINLDMAEAIGLSQVNYYEANGLPEDKLDELREWLEDVQTKNKARKDQRAMEEANRAAAAAGQMPPALGPPPGAAPPPEPPPGAPPNGAGPPMPPPGAPPEGQMMQ